MENTHIEQAVPLIRKRSDHVLSRKNIDPDALKVLYRLKQFGYTAYLVGGGVRDLLMGCRPKDFDVGTDALPREIKRVFRNAFLIGRRFRLAHIKFGSKVIETSTFRRTPDAEADPDDPNADLLHTWDNAFGSPVEDALRRDFTINGLFYDIKTYNIIDYVGGLDDLENRVIRSIGDPNLRFREDPVRMLRALRFSAKLGFSIESGTYLAILRHFREIDKASAPRLFEEILKLFVAGASRTAYTLLWRTHLLLALFPELDAYIRDNGCEKCLLWNVLGVLDDSVEPDMEPNPPFFLACLLYPAFAQHIAELKKKKTKFNYSDEIRRFIKPVAQRFRMPKRILFRLILIIYGQCRFEPEARKSFSRKRFVSQQYFPETLALREIMLRARNLGTDALKSWKLLYAEFLEEMEDGRVSIKDNLPQKYGRKRPAARGRARKSRFRPGARV